MDQCLCVGGAEPILAMKHYKIPIYILKILKLLWKFGISDSSSGLSHLGGKTWRRQCSHGRRRRCSCAHVGGLRFVCTAAAAGDVDLFGCPGHLSVEGFLCFVLFCPVVVWKKKQKEQTPFQTGSSLLDKPWTPILERGFSSTPELQAPEIIKCFLFSAS